MRDWFSDEDFWEAAYPFMFSKERFRAATEHVERVLAVAEGTPRQVLDLACGPGRYSIPLAQRGLTVTGVDGSAFLLEKARGRAAAEGADGIEWVHADMRDFRRPGRYDLALSMFTSFGFFDAPEDNQRVLDNVYASLAPGGCFLLDVAGKEVVARTFQPTDSQELPDGGLVVQRRRAIDGWGRLDVDWMLIQDGGVRTFRYRHWIYSGQELKAMLSAAGFGEVRLCGDLEGVEYGPEARRLIAVARR